MQGLIFYDSTMSVLEVLWDIALAYFVLCISTAQVAFTLSSSALVSYLRATMTATPGTSIFTPALALNALRILSALACARFVVVHYEMPRDLRFRAVVAAVTVAMTVAAATLVGWAVPARLLGGWTVEAEKEALAAGLMPLGLMLFERNTRPWLDGAVLGSEKKKRKVESVH